MAATIFSWDAGLDKRRMRGYVGVEFRQAVTPNLVGRRKTQLE